MTPRVITGLSLLAALAAATAVLTSQSDPTTRTLMKAKASYAHNLLDAVVQEDFETIRDQAFRLKAVTETADWNATEAPWYVHESDAFIRATDQLYEAAKAEDGNAATLAFMDLTMRCVQCHRGMRSP